jgi:hypothetical protein
MENKIKDTRGGRRLGSGRKLGTPNKITMDFKEALNNLLRECSPKMIEWIESVAEKDPAKSLDLISKLAEYVHPKISRSEVNVNMKAEVGYIDPPENQATETYNQTMKLSHVAD